MNRKRNLTYNTILGLANQVITLVCGFILPKMILNCYGTEVNGLVSSITQFISFISFADMGVIAVVQASLYNPLYKRNMDDVSRILISSTRFFRKIAVILVLYVIVLIVVYPSIIGNRFEFKFTAVLIAVISINSFLQYYFCLSNRILLSADQKDYVYLGILSIALLLSTLISVCLIKFNKSIVIVKFVSALVYVIIPIMLTCYVKKNYKLNMTLELRGEPIKQKWNGFAQHIAFIVLQNTDTVVLTVFSTLANVSIYNVYHLVISGVRSFISSATTGISPLFGSMIAGNENEKLTKTFDIYEWLLHTITTFVFTCTGLLIVPFVQVYTRGINDADYIRPAFSVLLTAAYGFLSLRNPYQSVVASAGHYKQTQASSLIEAGINIAISVVLVIKFGLIGVAVGTLCAMGYRTLYLVFYLKKNILYRSPKLFFKNIFIDIIIVLISVFISKGISLSDISYGAWIFMAVKISVITLIVIILANVIFNRELIKKVYKMILKPMAKKLKNNCFRK